MLRTRKNQSTRRRSLLCPGNRKAISKEFFVPKKSAGFFRKNQIFSTDVMIAAGIFIIAVMLFFYLLVFPAQTKKTEELTKDAETVSGMVFATKQSGENAFIVDNYVDKTKLATLSSKGYEQMKSELGVKNDFCIHFEDEHGNVINISDITKNSGIGIGSSKIEFVVENDKGEKIGTLSCSS